MFRAPLTRRATTVDVDRARVKASVTLANVSMPSNTNSTKVSGGGEGKTSYRNGVASGGDNRDPAVCSTLTVVTGRGTDGTCGLSWFRGGTKESNETRAAIVGSRGVTAVGKQPEALDGKLDGMDGRPGKGEQLNLSPHRMMAGFPGRRQSALQPQQVLDQMRHDRERRRASYERRTHAQPRTMLRRGIEGEGTTSREDRGEEEKGGGEGYPARLHSCGVSIHTLPLHTRVCKLATPLIPGNMSGDVFGRVSERASGSTLTIATVLNAAGLDAMKRSAAARVASVNIILEKARREAAAERMEFRM